MSFLSWVVSPVKISCQLIAGNVDGANETARNMIMSTPVLGHTVAVVAKVCGDDEEAEELFQEANSNLGAMANSIPGVGHAKGVVHYVCGDVEGGNEAMVAATRSTTVMAAGAGGFLLGGPVGAVAIGAETGAIWDTGVAIATDGEKLQGVYQIAKDPKNPWNYVDAGLGLVGDGMAGYSGGKMAERVLKKSEISTAENYRKKKGERGYKKDSKIMPKDEVYAEVKDKNTGQTHDGHNFKTRDKFNDHVPRGENEFVNKNPRPEVKHGNNCAETQAYHKYSRENPGVDTTKTRVNTIQIKENGKAYPMERCNDCKARADVMGKSNTDAKVEKFG